MAVTLHTLKEYCKKYRFAALVLLCGIVLMMLPSEKKTPEKTIDSQPDAATEESLQEQLETILSQISGAGRVQVLLSQEAGEEVLYQDDTSESGAGETGSRKRETVTVTSSDRAEQGLVRQRKAPVYRGAVVLCQGADSAAVRLAVVAAVSSATGLASNRITVLKMK